MVITYSIEKLNAIGEMVTLKEVISRIESQANNNQTFQQEFPQQFQQQLGHQITTSRESDKTGQMANGQEPLTYSVAEFFRKAQQNFYAQTSIDPTKVRSLSEVEAELIGQRSST